MLTDFESTRLSSTAKPQVVCEYRSHPFGRNAFSSASGMSQVTQRSACKCPKKKWKRKEQGRKEYCCPGRRLTTQVNLASPFYDVNENRNTTHEMLSLEPRLNASVVSFAAAASISL